MGGMQLKLYEEDVDIDLKGPAKWHDFAANHYNTKKKQWSIERQHMEAQLRRERAILAQRKQQQAAAAKVRAARIATGFKHDEVSADSWSIGLQAPVAVVEQSMRESEDACTRALDGADAHILVKCSEGEVLYDKKGKPVPKGGMENTTGRIAVSGVRHEMEIEHSIGSSKRNDSYQPSPTAIYMPRPLQSYYSRRHLFGALALLSRHSSPTLAPLVLSTSLAVSPRYVLLTSSSPTLLPTPHIPHRGDERTARCVR